MNKTLRQHMKPKQVSLPSSILRDMLDANICVICRPPVSAGRQGRDGRLEVMMPLNVVGHAVTVVLFVGLFRPNPQ